MNTTAVRRPLCVGLLLAGMVAPGLAQSQTDEPLIKAREAIITAPSADGTLRTTPHSVSVITAADIARSTAANVVELLGREANLNLQSFFGNAKNAGVDMRGMGDTAGSNVLVMVDGVRLNEPDLSGADLSTIPLDQIERIEVVRGGGAVRYGNGAVAGVINIITRGARPDGTHGEVSALTGSYGTTELRANARTGAGPFSIAASASRADTDGYRQNGYLNSRDGSAELRWNPTFDTGLVDLYFRVAQHRDEYGLPGPVDAAAFRSDSAARRGTQAPNDYGSTEDTRYTLGGKLDFAQLGQTTFTATHRDRKNPFIMGYSPIILPENQIDRITSRRHDVSLLHQLPFAAFGHNHSLRIGADLQNADYARRENGTDVVDASTRILGTADTRAWFANTVLQGPAGLAFTGGIRADRFETTRTSEVYNREFVLFPFPAPVAGSEAYRLQSRQGGRWNNRAAEVGLTWQATPALTTFVSATRHFRNPNVDELVSAATDLRPQHGRTEELGARYTPTDRLELAATVFRMRIHDEIYYGLTPGGLQENRNYGSPTRRLGGEFELRWRPLSALTIRGNVGYVDARFSASDARIPLVPRITASAEVEWALRESLRWAVSVRHAGERLDGNNVDGESTAPDLPAYTVYDTALRWEHGKVQVTAGIRNLFNEIYSTVGYSASYYPMPERNYYLSARLRF
ncbi:MAG: TonB-dependent receptor [Burkholderiales bacterium]|nr:TonB-dependent receptor [Burkholderiales bacterium]